MDLSDSKQSTAVSVRCGHTVQSVTLCWQTESETAVLVDAAGTVIEPQTVTVLRWPTGAEAALRRGGYRMTPYPDPAELWCNCAD